MTEISWDLLRTREMVSALYGQEQEGKAYDRFSSALQRWDYALFHLEELERAVMETNDTFAHAKPLAERVRLRLRITREEVETYSNYENQVGANATACVANLHAVADLFSQGVLYALGMSVTDKTLFSRSTVYPADIIQALDHSPETKGLAEHLDDLVSASDFEYLADFSNQSKHNSLVRTGLIMSMQDHRAAPYRAQFEGFKRRNRTHEQTDTIPILTREVDRQSELMVTAGNTLNELLVRRYSTA